MFERWGEGRGVVKAQDHMHRKTIVGYIQVLTADLYGHITDHFKSLASCSCQSKWVQKPELIMSGDSEVGRLLLWGLDRR